MCGKQGDFDSYHIHSNRHRYNPCSFYLSLNGLISPSYNPPSDYAQPYKAGWGHPGRQKQFGLLQQDLPSPLKGEGSKG